MLRTSEDGQTWSRWYSVTLERAAEEGGEEQAFTEPVWTGGGRYLQVAAQAAGDAEPVPVRLRDVRVVAINSTEDADRASAVVGVLRRAAATVAGTPAHRRRGGHDDPPGHRDARRSGAPTSPGGLARPTTRRSRWRSCTTPTSGNDYTAAEAPAVVRGVYAYHTKSLHWSDVGYNFLIDRYGTIYEGRYGGMTRGVIGAQVLGFNTGSTGISVIGTFTDADAPVACRHVARTPARVEAGRPSRRSAGHGDPRSAATARSSRPASG